MRISVITPTFNNGDELSEALKSVVNQSEFISEKLELELILVDDGSDPSHQEKLIELQADIEVDLKLIRLDENQGPAAARNAGIQAATGDWIGFVDSDDLWPEGKLTVLWPHLISDEFDILSGKIRYFSRNSASLPDLPYEDEANRIHHVHLGALLAKRTLFLEGLCFDESLRFGEDTDWWIRVREEKKSIKLIESETLIYNIHGENMTSQNQDQGREMLKLLHLSLKRRRQNSDQVDEIPSLKSFAYPPIEVIIPVYNGEKFIQQAIHSVLEQNIPVKKIWVVDDGSSDRTFSILEELQKENSKIEVLHQENQGVSAALNLVLPMIQEEWVAFLDADDLWEPDRIQSQVEYLQKNPSCSLVFGQIEEFEDFSGDQFRQFKAREGAMDGLNRSTLLCKKELFNVFGGFDQSLKVGEFIAWFQKVRESGQEYHVIPKILVRRRVHGENMTAKIDRKDFLHLLRRQITQKRNG